MPEELSVLHQLEAAANVVPPNIDAARLALREVGVELKLVTDKAQYLNRVAELSNKIAKASTGDVEIEFTTHAVSMQTIAGAFGKTEITAPTKTAVKKMTNAKSDKAAQ